MTIPQLTMTYRDHAHVVLDGDPSVIMELHEALSFEAPGAKYDPRVRKGHWDGRIHLIDKRKGTLYAGLAGHVVAYCKAKGIALDYAAPKVFDSWTTNEAEFFISTLDIPERFERRGYQVEAFRKAMNCDRQLFVSPTSSGKSMIIYWLTRAHPHKTLIIVPTIGLVHQMVSDFRDYGSTQTIHKIQDGRDIPAGTEVVVSTWQSIYEQDPEWFEQFGVVVGDEAHLFKAKSLTGIMTMMPHCRYRYGFTGTLDGSKVHELILNGLFGPTTHVTTTETLMKQGYVAQLKVEVIALQHPKAGREQLELKTSLALEENRNKGPKGQKRGAVIYQTEIAHIYADDRRNRFIVKMATRLPGNVLILFHHLTHGDRLFEMLVAETQRPVHLINGGVDGLERDEIRALVDAADDAILVASVGTSSTGINIRRINSLVMASPWKSRIVNLQSIGRGLRLADDKDSVTVYDVADSLSLSAHAPNTTLKHLAERVAIYEAEGFDFRVTKVDL